MTTQLSRRKFFAAGAGAAVAAPKIAGDLRGGNITGGIPVYGGADRTATSIPTDWARDRRSELEKLAAGDFSGEWDHNPLPAGDPRIDQLDALRSVSMSVKRNMANDIARRRAREGRQAWAKYELKDLIKRYFT